MSLLAVKPTSRLPSPSPLIFPSRSRLFSSLSFARKTNRRCVLRAGAHDSTDDKNSGAGDSKPPNGSLPKGRREILLEYVKNVQPEFMELFVKRAPQQVVDAMRQTVTNMIGTLPPQFFAVTVTTVAENLAQLMYSVMMTGYMFRNAQYRLELQQSLEQVALPDVQEKKDSPDYAPGTQKNVTGEVIKWNNVSGPEKIDAVKYIELLEGEIEELSRQLGRRSANGHNGLLEYLKSLEPQNLKELTSSAGEDVMLAMNTFIKRLLTVSDPGQMKTTATETSAPELARLLYWLMVVGYSIRNIESRGGIWWSVKKKYVSANLILKHAEVNHIKLKKAIAWDDFVLWKLSGYYDFDAVELSCLKTREVDKVNSFELIYGYGPMVPMVQVIVPSLEGEIVSKPNVDSQTGEKQAKVKELSFEKVSNDQYPIENDCNIDESVVSSSTNDITVESSHSQLEENEVEKNDAANEHNKTALATDVGGNHKSIITTTVVVESKLHLLDCGEMKQNVTVSLTEVECDEVEKSRLSTTGC
ncbi:hypothetical protein NE237_019392 [Protea cynaroides]|uniref:Uncharacterized protein n=1 Tax=Protea cynaroides TaxID=273540 RepID=A0A9Q0QPY7_9MAGN|nr:hypothetical protein NE237_019392 [Protea cynaroides]